MPPKNARRGTNVRSVDNASAVPPMDGGKWRGVEAMTNAIVW